MAERNEAGAPVYSNLDHELDQLVVDQLRDNPSLWGQHAAFNYCGWIRYDPDSNSWVEEVVQHGTIAKTFHDDDVAELISAVTNEFGSE